MRNPAWGIMLLVLTSCSKQSLPPLPTVDTSGFLPSIRAEVEREFAAVRAKPDDAGRTGRLGMLLHAHDRLEPALVCYERARLLESDDYRWVYLAAVVNASLSRTQAASDLFRKALALKPDDVPAKLGLADALLSAGDHAASRAIYEKVIEQHPSDPLALYGAGRTYAAERNTARAAELYERSLAAFPRYGAAHYALALACRQLGRTADAETHFAAYERDKSTSPPRQDPVLAEVRAMSRSILPLLAKAKTAAAAGRLQEAIELHQQALSIDPQQEQTHINLISLYGRSGNFGKAQEHYRAAVERNPNRDEAHYNYAVLLAAMGRQAEAVEAYRTTLRVNPLHPEANNNLAYFLARERKFEQALEHARKALESRPDYPQAHFNAATILLQRGESREAIRHLESALRPGDPNLATYLQALARTYGRTGDQERAREYALKAQTAARAAR